jgi:hypothetical protein
MEALIEALLKEHSLEDGSTHCSAAFQKDLQSFLNTQVQKAPFLPHAWPALHALQQGAACSP